MMKRENNQRKKVNTGYLDFKYALDFIFAFFALIATSPVFAAVAIAIKIEDGGKVIFSQPRRGRYGKIFNCYKFRSMKDTDIPFDPNRPVIKDNNANLTKVGKVIRKLRIDELPQLANILRGEMCIIGHRPLMAHHFQYEEWELIKFEMRPGLTGLGQVSGNSHLKDRTRRYYDAYYVTHLSFFADVKIFFKTIAVLFAGERRFIKRVPWDEYNALKLDVIENYKINEATAGNFDEGEVIPNKPISQPEAAMTEASKE
ncbi:MAG: sugar transferase [Clostridia bacterium]|nr:sugar transferase [Clostridia bacterium]